MPYNGVTFRNVSLPQNNLSIEVPEFWSEAACAIFVDRCLTHHLIPAKLKAIEEFDVPDWLWRHEAGANLTGASFKREVSVRSVIDRIVGGKTYLGWKAGYFEAEADAHAYFDELRWMLCHQMASPEITQWRDGGLHWAYGITTAADDCYLVDYKTGKVRRAEFGELPPHGAYINAVSGPAESEGGAWDLWRRESQQRANGCSTGVNISSIAPRTARETTGQGYLTQMLGIGDAGAALSERSPGQRRRITIDDSHPDCTEILQARAATRDQATATKIGSEITDRHLRAIAEAAHNPAPDRRRADRRCPAFRLAIQSARLVHIPEEQIDRAIRMGRNNEGNWPAYIPAEESRAPANITAIRITGSDIDRNTGNIVDPAPPFSQATNLAWIAGDCALHFSDAANAFNGCAESGAIHSASGMGDYLFLDDTACARGVINAAAFIDDKGQVDLDGFRHTVTLMTILLDLTHLETGHPTPRLGRRSWDFRPVGLSPTGTGEMLMRIGIAYDSDDGRTICGALCGILSATAFTVSARLSLELGAFPEFDRNTKPLNHVLQSYRHAAEALTDDGDWTSLCKDAWVDAVRLAERHGVRNAVVSLIYDSVEESRLLDCASVGVAPCLAVIQPGEHPCSRAVPRVTSAIRDGLNALGYSRHRTNAIIRHIVGHGTLKDAPGVNHENLRQRGFTELVLSEIELALANTTDIRRIFSRWVLGDECCETMLGLPRAEFLTENFDILTALGFSEAGIEAANLYCCGAGNLQGAPHLDPAHLAVFDCIRPQGKRGDRQTSAKAVLGMAIAAQPLVTGGVGQVIEMAETASMADCREIMHAGWQAGLRGMMVRTSREEFSGNYGDEKPDAADRQALYLVAKNAAPATPALNSGPESVPERKIAMTAEKQHRDKKTSHRTASDSVESVTSVSSSADVTVEQRQV
jgi:ribonucleoside-diphosphate reductase alpha chain